MNKHISLELAKKLHKAGCDLESDYYWVNVDAPINSMKGIKAPFILKGKGLWDKWYPAYDILWEICVKYQDKFFGVENAMEVSGMILRLLTEGKEKEADREIWEDCKWRNSEGKALEN